MPGARCARSLVCNWWSRAYECRHYRFTGITRHSLRDGFNGLLRDLPGVPGFLATVACGSLSANLTPASGCQDHTISPYAPAPFVRGASHVHRIPPRVNDDREPPLCGTGR